MIDRSGQKYNRLTAIELHNPYRSQWLCKCDCGKEVVVTGSNLVTGYTKSCGCIQSLANTTHGYSRRKVYIAWDNMKARCTNPNTIEYHRYGGRGITVCDRWFDFNNFLTDVGEPPSDDHSIDRINNNGNYEPGNVRWATRQEQALNKG